MLPELERALQLHRLGQAAEALPLYASALAAEPDNLAALFYGGVAAQSAGDPSLALARLNHLITIGPEASPDAHYHRALAYASMGAAPSAMADYETALRLKPEFFAAHNNLGNLHRMQGDFALADAAFAKALRIRPDNVDALYNRALNAFESGDLARAKVYLQDCVRRDPGHASARATLVDAMLDMGDVAGAVALARESSRRMPSSAEVLNALGSAEEEAGHMTEALSAYRAALGNSPGDPRIAMNLMHLENENADPDAARRTCDSALRVNERAGLRFRRATLLPVIPTDEEAVDRARAHLRAELAALRAAKLHVVDPLEELGTTPFYLSYHGRGDDRELLQEFAATVREVAPSIGFTAPHVERARKPGKPRIGVCSHFLFGHSVGRALHAVIAALSIDEFELHLFLVPPLVQDSLSREMQARAIVHHLPFGLAAAREAIASTELDLLLYPELGLEALTYYLAHARLARAQWTTLGHPCTSGLATVDTFVSYAAIETEGSERFYSESLLRIAQGLPFPAYPPDELSGTRRDRATLGFVDDGPLLICPQSLFKLMPGFDVSLAAIMDACPRAILLLPEGLLPGQTASIKARFARSLGSAAQRVWFFPRRPRGEFVELIAACDLVLDPFPVGGGITTWDALAAGTPIVTLPGSHMRSRFAWSALREAGIDSTIATDEAGYTAIATRLLLGAEERQGVRGQLTAAAPALRADTRAIPCWLDAVRETVAQR